MTVHHINNKVAICYGIFKVYCRVHESPLLNLTLSQFNTIYILILFCWREFPLLFSSLPLYLTNFQLKFCKHPAAYTHFVSFNFSIANGTSWRVGFTYHKISLNLISYFSNLSFESNSPQHLNFIITDRYMSQYCGTHLTCRVPEPLLSQFIGSEGPCETGEHGFVTGPATHSGCTADLHSGNEASPTAGEVWVLDLEVQSHCLGVQSLWVRLVSSLTVLPDPRVYLKQQRIPSIVTWIVWWQPHFAARGDLSIWIRRHYHRIQRKPQPNGPINYVALQKNGSFLSHRPVGLTGKPELQSSTQKWEEETLPRPLGDVMPPQRSVWRWIFIWNIWLRSLKTCVRQQPWNKHLYNSCC
jgi:hypothetical protein